MENQRVGGDPSNGVVKSVHYEMSVEELVSKAIAPVKKEFRRPPPVRSSDNSDNQNADGGKDEKDEGVSAPVIKEKKSKRQQKRERQQVRTSTPHLCPMVAKSGNVSSCQYSENCRYSHNMEAYKLQKPDDLEGICPFFDDEGPCPYGLTCRYGSTHKDYAGVEMVNAQRKSSEINGLKKDVQKLLWKNKMKFPKADAALKLLGLQGPPAKNKKLADNEDVGETLSNGSGNVDENESSKLTANSSIEVLCPTEVVAEGKPGEPDVTDDLRLPKKPKCLTDESCLDETTNDQPLVVNDVDRSYEQKEPETIVDHMMEDTEKSLKLHAREKKLIDFREKLYLAPLTTVGNLPFRRVCKVLGADVTCGEMAMCTNLLQGQASEWALLRRHSSEDFFGVQICGAFPDTVAKTVELIEQNCTVDFIDINMGCPIDLVCNKGGGSALLTKPMRMKNVIDASSRAVDIPLTVKVRTGYYEGKNRIDSLIADMGSWGATAITVHGRTRQQRYTKLADWDYIYKCARAAPSSLQVIGNGDMFSYLDWNSHKSDCPELSSCMIARGALVKPWIFTEIKEQRHWDISSGERLDILKDYVRFGLQHWGSDSKGVETTRHFLLEWLSYTCRYIPIGISEVIPKINWRPPAYFGRDDLETLMASESAADWIKISELLLGKVPSGFTFAPKHKTNAYYDKAENG